MTSATRWSARSGSATCSPSRPRTASKISDWHPTVSCTHDFAIETTVYTVWHVASVVIYSSSVGFCCSTEDGAVKPSLGGGKESLQQACRVSGQDKAATGNWTHRLWNMNYQR